MSFVFILISNHYRVGCSRSNVLQLLILNIKVCEKVCSNSWYRLFDVLFTSFMQVSIVLNTFRFNIDKVM